MSFTLVSLVKQDGGCVFLNFHVIDFCLCSLLQIYVHVIFVVETLEKRQIEFDDTSSMGVFFCKAQSDNTHASSHVGLHGASLL